MKNVLAVYMNRLYTISGYKLYIYAVYYNYYTPACNKIKYFCLLGLLDRLK